MVKNYFFIFIALTTLMFSETSYSKTIEKYCSYFDKEEILNSKNQKIIKKEFKKYKLSIKKTHLNVMKKFYFKVSVDNDYDAFVKARDLCDEIKIYISKNILQNFTEKNSDIAQIKTTKKIKTENINLKSNNNEELLTAQILNDYTLKDHFLGERNTEFMVKKNQIYKIVVLKENYNFALITNTKDWKKKGSIEGWIPLEYLKIQNENYVFNNTDTNKKIEKQNTKKVTKQVVNNNNKNFYCKDRNGKVFNLKKPLHNNQVNKCGSMMKEISKSQYDSIKNRTISITKNKTNNKKESYKNTTKNYVMNKQWLYCERIKENGQIQVMKLNKKSSGVRDCIGTAFKITSSVNNYCSKSSDKYPSINKIRDPECFSDLLNKDENIQIVETETNSRVKKKEQTVVVINDAIGPEIIVNKTFKANDDLTASIQGRITDKSAIVSLVIDGDEVSMVNGSFNKELYVFPGGQEVQIIARDKHGNKSETTVQLVRATVVVQEDKFDFLDPRKIKAKTNINAVAIIIGIESYENTFAAPFATNDAVIFNDFARLSLGIPANNIKLLTNDEAERNDTLNVLRTWLPKKIIDNQTELYVFYSGHGLASDNGEDLFLLPYDGYPELLEDSTLLRNRIFQDIAKLNPKSVTVFLDTCYSGATRSEEFLVAAKPIFIEVAEQEIPNNFTVFSASAGKETAKILEEAEHGLFSYYMMKGLEGDADVNSDNQITNGELLTFIKKNVSRQANQTPQLNGIADQVLTKW